MTRKSRAITLTCSDAEKASLEAIAKKYGFLWGDTKPNVSALIKAIANEEIPLGPSTPELRLKAEIKRLEAELKEKKAKLK